MTLTSNGRGWLWPLTGLGFVVAAGSGILFVFHVAVVVVLALGVVAALGVPGFPAPSRGW